jgi:rhodanese-related sulfurtransferase
MPAWKTGADLINDAKARVTETSPREALTLHGQNVVFLDVREPNEWNLGRIPEAVHVPRGQLEGKIEGVIDRAMRVVVYCATGNRSALAADTMQQMGYEHVTSLRDGFRGWAEAGGTVQD